MSNVGKNLTPAEFGIKSGDERKVSPNTTPDQFGQVNSADKDFTGGGVPSARESVQAHQRSDVDASRRSQHHTLGRGHNQASPGNHVHDGINGPKLGLYQMDPANTGRAVPSLTLTGSKGGNVALANLITMLKNFIDFNDTTT